MAHRKVVFVCFTAVAGVAGAAASAAAQPTLAPAEPTVEAYPVEHADRPLLLPAGAIEGGARLDVLDYDVDGLDRELYQLAPNVRYGLANAEVEARLTMALNDYDEFSDTPLVQAIDLVGRMAIGESSAAGIELQSTTPMEDYGSYVIGAVMSTRRRFGGAALDLGGGAAYGIGRGESTLDTIRLQGSVAATAQVAPMVGVQVRAVQHWYDYLGEDVIGLPSSTFAQEYGVRALFAATPSVDVIAGADILGTGDVTIHVYTLGVVARRVP